MVVVNRPTKVISVTECTKVHNVWSNHSKRKFYVSYEEIKDGQFVKEKDLYFTRLAKDANNKARELFDKYKADELYLWTEKRAFCLRGD